MSGLTLKPFDHEAWAVGRGIPLAALQRVRALTKYGPIVFAKSDDLEMVILSAPEQKLPFIRAGVPFAQLFTLREIIELLGITESDPSDASRILSLMLPTSEAAER